MVIYSIICLNINYYTFGILSISNFNFIVSYTIRFMIYICSSLSFEYIIFTVPLFINNSIIFMNIYSVFFIKIDSSNLKGLWVIVKLGFGVLNRK